MKRSMIALFCGCWLWLAVGAQAQTPTADAQPQAAVTRQLLAEVKALRRELLQQAIEFQQWKLQQISRELHQAQTEQQRLAGEEQMLQLELIELSAASAGQDELETLKAELTGPRTQQLHRRQQPLNQRIGELTEQSHREETRLRQLTERLKRETSQAAK